MSGPQAHRPEASAPREYAFPEVLWTSLSNGLRLAVAPITRLPLVTVLALVDAGASRDTAGAEGMATLTAQALSEGTLRLDGAALTEQFESLGTGLDTDSDWDETTAELTVTPSRLEAAISLLGEVLTAPAFTDREVERLKSERLAELLQQQMEPRSLADDKFTECLYAAGSRYGVPQGGSGATVQGLHARQVRGFYERRYVPATTTLIVAGDVTSELVVRFGERTLGPWRGDASPSGAVQDSARANARRIHVVNKTDAPQTELRIGHRGVPRAHPDYFSIVVMNALLGGLFSSRINLNLRERNAYTYGARSAFEWRRAAGPFVVSTAVKTEVTQAAASEILQEITRFREETVSDEELSLATAYLDGVFPIRYETTTAVARAIASAHVHGLSEDYFTSYRKRVRGVSAVDVRQAAQTHLHVDELLVLAVGDAQAICEPLSCLGLGPSEVHAAKDP